jgi:hypothetical protein
LRRLSLLIVFLLPLVPARAAAEERPLHERVSEAIDRGVAWLLAKPKLATLEGTKIAHWGLTTTKEAYGGGNLQYQYPVGATALALYTLLKCGVDPKHPVIERGFAWMRLEHELTEEFDGMPTMRGWCTSYREAWTSYELSAEILALTARYDPRKDTRATQSARKKGKLKIKDKQDRKWLQELVQALVARRGATTKSRRPEDRMGWRYNQTSSQWQKGESPSKAQRARGRFVDPSDQDLSSTQLAALALFSAHQFGVKVDEGVWADIARFSLSCQETDGPAHERHDPGYKPAGYAAPRDHARGFCYIKGSTHRNEGTATGAMTTCGIANLLMARGVLGETSTGRSLLSAYKLNRGIEKAVWDGLAWLDLHWSAWSNPQVGASYNIYYLYGLERAMDLMGKELVGVHPWYRLGAEEILKHGKPAEVDGKPALFWETRTTHRPYDVLDTCFALLFLKRATKGLVPAGVPITGG